MSFVGDIFIYMFIHSIVMSKIISIADDVYNDLSRRKGNESYSSILRMILHPKSNKEKLLSLGKEGSVDKKAVKELKAGWRRWTKKFV